MADEKPTEEAIEEQEQATPVSKPSRGSAADGAVGGSGGCGGGVSSYTASGNEKVPPRSKRT